MIDRSSEERSVTLAMYITVADCVLSDSVGPTMTLGKGSIAKMSSGVSVSYKQLWDSQSQESSQSCND